MLWVGALDEEALELELSVLHFEEDFESCEVAIDDRRDSFAGDFFAILVEPKGEVGLGGGGFLPIIALGKGQFLEAGDDEGGLEKGEEITGFGASFLIEKHAINGFEGEGLVDGGEASSFEDFCLQGFVVPRGGGEAVG